MSRQECRTESATHEGRCVVHVRCLDGTEALGRREVPGVGRQAYYKDTEGTIFGMMQAMPQCKME